MSPEWAGLGLEFHRYRERLLRWSLHSWLVARNLLSQRRLCPCRLTGAAGKREGSYLKRQYGTQQLNQRRRSVRYYLRQLDRMLVDLRVVCWRLDHGTPYWSAEIRQWVW